MKAFACFIALFLSIFILSCGDGNDLPPCIQEVTSLSASVSIYTQQLNGETHYLIGINSNFSGDDEAIVDAECNELCVNTTFLPPPCLAAYSDNWILVYP